jgi:putative FmdB family regulatory protein
VPLYEYRCKQCNHHFEKIQKFSDEPILVCPNCGRQAVEQLLSAPAIQFKGSGWYVTDYARKGNGFSAASSEGAPSTPPSPPTPASTPAPASTSSEHK